MKDVTNKFDARMTIEENVKDYCLTITNDHADGLGIRIHAGKSIAEHESGHSVAIFSVADRENDNKFVVKSNGAVVSFHSHTIGNIYMTKNRISSQNHKPIQFKAPITLDYCIKEDLPTLSPEAGSVVMLSDENYKPVYYDGNSWRYFSNDEVVNEEV